MKRKVAPGKAALKKRVERFFDDSSHIRADVMGFIGMFTEHTNSNLYAFGGLVRDIGLSGVREFSSDVDLVFDGEQSDLVSTLDRLPLEQVTENKFGGFRVKLSNWDVDIWCAKNTWAIKQGLVDYVNIESLLNTTLLSWDSVLFDPVHKKLLCSHQYLDDLADGRLDIVLTETPNELGSIVRLARAIYSKGAEKLGHKAETLMLNFFEKYSVSEILQYEENSYRHRYLTNKRVDELISYIEKRDLYSQINPHPQMELSTFHSHKH